MIVILKRSDLLDEHRHQTVEGLDLNHFLLSSELIDQAELIVFVEGKAVKFLKHFPEIQSTNHFDVLLLYITSTLPITKERPPWSVKHFRPRKKKE